MKLNKNKMKKFWAKVTVGLMLMQLFSPAGTALADSLDNIPQSVVSTENTATSDKKADTKQSSEDIKQEPKAPVESANDQNKNSEEATGESQNSNDSPILESPLETQSTFEEATVKEESNLITFGSDGVPLLNGEAFYKNEDQIKNEDLQELMKQGGKIESDGFTVRSFMTRAGVTIEYLGQVTYGYNIVGHFKVNGEEAFCIEHSKPTPPTGTPAEEAPYDNENIAKTLYYGWNGSENIFTNFAEGYTATSLVLSYFYTGVASGLNTPEGQALLNKVNSSTLPDPSASFSTLNPKVNVINGEQRTEDIKLNGDSRNIFKLQVPVGMTYHLVGGGTLTNGTAEIKGGDTFYLTADMKYTNDFASGAMAGTMKKYQPILTKPADGNLQTLGRGKWYIDPNNTLQFTASFFARTGNAEFLKVSEETGEKLANVPYLVTIDGKTTEVKTDANGSFKFNDIIDGTVVKVKEKDALEGYVTDGKEYTITIEAGKTVTLTLKNKVQKGKIKGYKQIEVFNEEETEKQGKPVYDTKPAEGKVFDVKAVNDITLPDKTTVKNKAGDIVDTVTTNAKGEFASNVELWIGAQNEYKLVERDVPAHYRDPSDVQTTFSIPYGKNTEALITYDLGTIDNLLKTGTWEFNKKNEVTLEGLDGAKFMVERLSKPNKGAIYTFMSSELGNVFKLPAGDYRVTEIEFPDGFTQTLGESETKIITIKDNETTVTNWNNSPIEEKQPKMGTQAYAENGGKDFDPAVDNKLYDKISNENYDDDTKYFVTKVIGETTGTVYFESKGEKTLDENGEVIVETFIPAGTVQKENIYFVEEAYNSKESFEKGDKPYTEHDGKNDYGQTLFYKEKPVIPEIPKTPVVPNKPVTPIKVSTPAPVVQKQKIVLPQTGESVQEYVMIGLIIVIAGMAFLFMVRHNNAKRLKEQNIAKARLYGIGGEKSIFNEDNAETRYKSDMATNLVVRSFETGSKEGLETEECQALLKAIKNDTSHVVESTYLNKFPEVNRE